MSIQPCRNTGWLCWTAMVLSLAAGVGICTWALVEGIGHHANDPEDFHLAVSEFLPLFMLTLLWYVVPGVIAWRWPLIGGLFLMLQSGLYILFLVWNYSELDRTGALRILLLAALCTGGVLHLAVWWRDRQKKAEI